jgi:hypothetical protein
MRVQPLNPLNMNASVSISNYENLGLFINHTSSSKSASEKNGRAIRRKFRNPMSVKQTPITFEYSVEVSVLNLIGGGKRETEIVTVKGGGIEKRFVSLELAQRWVENNG